MKVPAGKIPLTEAFQEYFERRWRDAPIQLAIKRRIHKAQKIFDKWEEKLEHLAAEEKCKLREKRRKLRDKLSGELECISKEQDDAAKAFRAAFENGELVAEVCELVADGKGGKTKMESVLTREQWRDALFPERLFFASKIVASVGDPLFDYTSLHPYTDKAVFDRWLIATCRANKKRSTVAAENRCREWLVEEIRKGPQAGNKASYAEKAQKSFGVSARGFVRIWRKALAQANNQDWSKPGRRPDKS
jgi:hypothetical protein